MRKTTYAAILVGLLGAAIPTQAGFICTCTPTIDSPNAATYQANWNTVLDQNNNVTSVNLNITAAPTVLGHDTLSLVGSANDDPLVNANEQIQNLTGLQWVSYLVHIVPLDAGGTITPGSIIASDSVAGVNGSVPYASVVPIYQPGGDAYINFFTGFVNPGDTLTMNFTFDIVPDINGSFDYAIHNQPNMAPVPEPASLGLLALGVMGLLARRKK